jgi:hypothetical protein
MTPTSPFTNPIMGSPSIEMMRSGNGNGNANAKGTNGVPDFFSLGPSVLSPGQSALNGQTMLEQTIHDVGAPLSPFHYHLRKVSS